MSREPKIAEASERSLLALLDPGAARAERPEAGTNGAETPAEADATDPEGRAPLPDALLRGERSWTARWRRLWIALPAAIETELDRGAAMLAVPVCLAVGAFVYFGLETEPAFGQLMLAGCLTVAARAAVRSTRPWLRMALSAALLIAIGASLAKLETWRAGTKMLAGEISTQLTGKVIAIDHLANRRIRLTLDVVATARPTLRHAPQRVRASARDVPPGLRIGSEVSGIVKLLPISGPLRPGSYDFSFESYFDGLGATGFFLKGPELSAASVTETPGGRLFAFVENARLAVADRIRDRIGGAEGEIAAALVVGVRAGIPDSVNEALRKSGLYHVISISGLHMALVAGTIMGVLRLGFAFFPGLSSRRPVKKVAAFAALVATGAYLLFSGAEVAAQRSYVMLAVMLAAVLFDRPAVTMRNLAIAATAVIVASPHEVVGPSFQMSFAAAAALIGTYAAWSERMLRQPRDIPVRRTIAGRLFRKLWMGAAGLAATSLIAGVATAIFGAYHFQRVSPFSLGANLAAMPAVSALVMPFAVLAAIAMPLGLDGPFLDVMGEGLSIMIAVAEWFSARSPVDAVGTVSATAVVVLAGALLVATLATTWLRAAAVPVALAGLALLGADDRPHVLVSEDARLVAVDAGGRLMAVNRSRPSAFHLEDWQRSFASDAVERPTTASGNPAAAGFRCGEGLCVMHHPSGAVIAYAQDLGAAKRACAAASLVILDDATVEKPCGPKGPVVIGKRRLAQRGAASVVLPSSGAGSAKPLVTYAIGTQYRPWHEHRRFSREARGMAAYERQARRTVASDIGPPETGVGEVGSQQDDQ